MFLHFLIAIQDNAEALEDSPLCKQDPFKGRKEEPEGLSESSSEDGDSKNSDEGLPINDHNNLNIVQKTSYISTIFSGKTLSENIAVILHNLVILDHTENLNFLPTGYCVFVLLNQSDYIAYKP